MRSIPACLLLLTALSWATPVCHQPPLSDEFDAIAVFLPGGLPPASPWEGVSDEFRERFWTLGCEGFLIQRTAWCAYLAVTPPGTADLFVSEMAAMGDSAVIADTSVWSGFLQLEAVNREGPVAIVWHRCDEPGPAPAIPLRGSRWLASGSDTLISNGPWSTSTFLWTVDTTAAGSYDGVWRGSGTEIVPVGEGSSVAVRVLCSSGITPAELQFTEGMSHGWDAEFGRIWAPLFSAVDSLVASEFPPVPGAGNLLWLKGSGSGGAFEPWKTSAAPTPPARARMTVPSPSSVPAFHAMNSMPVADGVSSTDIACTGATFDETAVFAGVFERILARSALPGIPGTASVTVEPMGDSIRVWMIGSGGIDAAELAGMLPRLLGPTALCPPESELVANAALRARLLHGSTAAVPSPTTMVHILAGVLGLLD